MNTPVSFKISKLLNGKGFDLKTTAYYSGLNIYLDGVRFDYNDKTIESPTHKGNGGLYSSPTIAEVIMWLYEKYGIWIGVDCDCYGILWYANLSVASEKNWDNIDLRHEIISASKKFPNEHNSPTEAYEAALLYTLKNLI